MQIPNNEEQWRDIERDFNVKWNFPGCIGAIDGKHVVIRPPPFSGSEYYNYKHSFSIVLLAVADANYCFRYIDVGAQGRHSDGGVFDNSSLKESIEKNELRIPHGYVLVGDEAFPLKPYLMRPYPRRELNSNCKIYNYRLSRARRTVENAFGILVSRFQVFQKAIATSVPTAIKIIRTACAMHNWLRSTSDSSYFTPGLIDTDDANNSSFTPGSWREQKSDGLSKLQSLPPRRPDNNAREIRDRYCEYFNGDGAVPWQNEIIR